MAMLSFSGKDLPFLPGGGEIFVDIGGLAPHCPFPEAGAEVFTVSFKGNGYGNKLRLGRKGSVRLSISSSARLTLTPVFPSSKSKAAKLLKDNGLGEFFRKNRNSDKLVLVLEAAAAAETSALFAYRTLKTEFEIGADGGYVCAGAFDKADAAGEIIKEFFLSLRLPGEQARAFEPGEAVALRYSGYLRLGADASVGCRFAATEKAAAGNREFSVKTETGVIAEAGFQADVAGDFVLLMTAAENLPGWAAVKVTRSHARRRKIAADVRVNFKSRLPQLTSGADKFTTDVIGFHAEDFLELLKTALDFSDYAQSPQTVRGSAQDDAALLNAVRRIFAGAGMAEFLSGLLGQTLNESSGIEKAMNAIRSALQSIGDFKEKFFAALKQAASRSYALVLHSGYNRASKEEALIDIAINLADPRGVKLLTRASAGDFEAVASVCDNGLLRLREAVFISAAGRERSFALDISGWNPGSRYEQFRRLVTETEQRIVPSGRGLTVYTALTLELEKTRRRRDEKAQVNFLLRVLGESAGAVRRGDGYLINTLGALTASYRFKFSDDDVSEEELNDALALARQIGLDAKGATLAELRPFLPRTANGTFGKIEMDYDVRFDARAANALLGVRQLTQEQKASLRAAMRTLVYVNYRRSSALGDVALAYAAPGIFTLFEKEGSAEFCEDSLRVFRLGVPPREVKLDRAERNFVVTLYNIENELIRAVEKFLLLLASGEKDLTPVEFAKKSERFGKAMEKFDEFDQPGDDYGIGMNTVFIMFDRLLATASAEKPVNQSRLRLKSRVEGKTAEKVFFSDAWT